MANQPRKAVWICHLVGYPAPHGTGRPGSPICQPGSVHQDHRCGWAWEGSADYDEALKTYGFATHKPFIYQAGKYGPELLGRLDEVKVTTDG
jgi:hypothetical protein